MNGHRLFPASGSERAQNSAYRSAPQSKIEDRGWPRATTQPSILDPQSSIFNLRTEKANQGLKMTKYAFLRSNGSLIVIGLLLGLVGGFKIANSQYRSEQGEALKRDITRATNGMSGSQAEVSA